MAETKRDVKFEAEVRANTYSTLINALESTGAQCEPIKGGTMAVLADGTHIKVSVSVVSEEKVDKYRTDYADQQAKNAERAQERAAKAEEKAAKAAERAAKKAAKDAE